jgi:histidyl-tRNA synthetase
MSRVKGIQFLDVHNANLYQLHLDVLTKVAEQFNFKQVIPPIITEFDLFTNTMHDSTVVKKEMFKVHSQGKENLVLRPEGTALVADYLLQHGMLRNKEVQRYWYYGPMFRYERPQRGRFRQFYQFGLESFCVSPLLQEVEIIYLCWKAMQAMGIEDLVTLEINNLGTPDECKAYTQVLIEYLHSCNLTEEQRKTLHNNPLRCLDTKDASLLEELINAPKITDYVEQNKFMKVVNCLKDLDIPLVINPLLVRGLDYYCHTVFEWKFKGDDLGTQSTICAGGRYDSIFQSLGGSNVPSMGCAFGMDRLCMVSKLTPPTTYKPVYLFAYTQDDLIDALLMQQQYADSIHLEDKQLSYNSHLKRAPYKAKVIYMRNRDLYDAITNTLLSRSSFDMDT